MLSTMGSQVKFLKTVVKNERQHLEKRIKYLEDLESKVDEIDVRGDLSWFMERQTNLTEKVRNLRRAKAATTTFYIILTLRFSSSSPRSSSQVATRLTTEASQLPSPFSTPSTTSPKRTTRTITTSSTTIPGRARPISSSTSS